MVPPGASPSAALPVSEGAEDALIRAMRALDACAAEFGLASGYCGEHLDALYTALDRLDPPEPSPQESYRLALESIAKNTCCETCREAALVARAALEGRP